MAVFKIPAQNVLRHKDIAPSRKWDIADTFWNGKFKTWTEFQKALKPVQA
jgi:N-acetyl-anhydromuramyl-L-alanine amidase AmpD